MELFDPISKIRSRGVEVNNHTIATTMAEDWDATQQEYEQAVFEITGSYIHTEFPAQAKQLFINVVANSVKQHCADDEVAIDTSVVLSDAKKQAEKYFSVFRSKVPEGCAVRWRSAGRQEIAALIQHHKETYVKPVSKQDRAIEIIKANPTLSNKQLQTMFRDQLKLTANGAATYVYNVRKILAKQ